jgi:hypothetical protein
MCATLVIFKKTAQRKQPPSRRNLAQSGHPEGWPLMDSDVNNEKRDNEGCVRPGSSCETFEIGFCQLRRVQKY